MHPRLDRRATVARVVELTRACHRRDRANLDGFPGCRGRLARSCRWFGSRLAPAPGSLGGFGVARGQDEKQPYRNWCGYREPEGYGYKRALEPGPHVVLQPFYVVEAGPRVEGRRSGRLAVLVRLLNTPALSLSGGASGTLPLLEGGGVLAELGFQRVAHSATPRFFRSRARPRSAWFCTVVFFVPSSSATSLMLHS